MVAAGTFREDLYYRLNVVEVAVPPLAQRRDDVVPLAEHFLAGRAPLGAAARELLLGHPWPGNVRELKNVIERAAVLAGGEPITPEGLALPEPRAGLSNHRNLEEPSRETVVQALARA